MVNVTIIEALKPTRANACVLTSSSFFFNFEQKLQLRTAIEVFVFNTNLVFLYKIDIEGFQKVSGKNKVASSGI